MGQIARALRLTINRSQIWRFQFARTEQKTDMTHIAVSMTEKLTRSSITFLSPAYPHQSFQHFKYVCPCSRKPSLRTSTPPRIFAMSVADDAPETARKGFEFTIHNHCVARSETVARFLSAEMGTFVPHDEIRCLMNSEGLVAVSATAPGTPQQLIAVAIAVPAHAPHIPASSGYALTNLAVAKSHRRQGIARRVVGEIIRICEQERR